ncbi:MAG: glycosyltransferase family 4 protein [Chloroflexi bacterium]|nr:glycosyltransferase family 4 protein [Chloroflexota bacterium]
MRIVVCSGQIPFVRGGSEILTDALAEQLRRRGHAVEIVRIPFRWYPKEEILKGYLAWRLINLEESEGQRIDRVIALKFPAYVVPHSHKTVWLVQQFRQAYDLFNTEYSHFDSSAADTELRQTIRHMDTISIGEAERIFTISKNVGARLRRYNGLDAETLYPPPALDGHYYHAEYGDYVLSMARLNPLKRVDWLIEAMAYTKTPVRCLIAGRGEETERLQSLAREWGVADRIEFLGFVRDEQAIELYAHALAVYYAPLDEDYGLATVEAFKSSKPVLTGEDSGGVLEFVHDGLSGLVVPSRDAQALAETIDHLYAHREIAARLGAAGREIVAPIHWDVTIERLLGG